MTAWPVCCRAPRKPSLGETITEDAGPRQAARAAVETMDAIRPTRAILKREFAGRGGVRGPQLSLAGQRECVGSR